MYHGMPHPLKVAKTTPVKPPIVNKAKKPNVYNIGAVNLKEPP